VNDRYLDTQAFADLLGDDITWLKKVTDGRVDYTSSISSDGCQQDAELFVSQSEQEIEILDFSAEDINTLPRDLEASNKKKCYFS
jgi:hypothetical protein